MAALLASPAGAQALCKLDAVGLSPLGAAEALLREHGDVQARALAVAAAHGTNAADEGMAAFWRAHALKHSAALAHTVVAVAAESGWLVGEQLQGSPESAAALAPAQAARAAHSLASIAASLNVAGPRRSGDRAPSQVCNAAAELSSQSGNEPTAKQPGGLWSLRMQQQSAFDMCSEAPVDEAYAQGPVQFAEPETGKGNASAVAAEAGRDGTNIDSDVAARADSVAPQAVQECGANGASTKQDDAPGVKSREAPAARLSPLSHSMGAEALKSNDSNDISHAPRRREQPEQPDSAAKDVPAVGERHDTAALAGASQGPLQTRTDASASVGVTQGSDGMANAEAADDEATQSDEEVPRRAAQTPPHGGNTPSTSSPAQRSPQRPGSGRSRLLRSGSAASEGRGGSLAAIASRDSLHSLPSFSRWASLSLSRSLSLGPLVQCAIVDGVDATLGTARVSESQGSPTSVAGRSRPFAEFPSPRAISRALSVGTSGLEAAPAAPASHWGALELLFSQGDGGGGVGGGSAASSAVRCSLSSRRESTNGPTPGAALAVPDLSAALQAVAQRAPQQQQQQPQHRRRMAVTVPATLVAALCRLVVDVAGSPATVGTEKGADLDAPCPSRVRLRTALKT